MKKFQIKTGLPIRSFLIIGVITLLSYSFSIAQLAGNYSIDQSGTGDYVSFTEAINALSSQGVSAAVVFTVVNGSYNEQLVIPPIDGTSVSNTVTFTSFSGDSTGVTLFYSASSTSNFTVKLDTANYIIFEKMTISATNPSYGRVFYLTSNASNNTIFSCRLIGITTSGSSTSLAIIFSQSSQNDNNSFLNNIFIDGSYGINLKGISSSVLSVGNSVDNNQFTNQAEIAIALYNQDAPIVNNNMIETSNSYTYGIYLEYCDKNLQIMGNKNNLTNGNFGIYLKYCDGNVAQKGTIANNFVTVGGSNAANGIALFNTTYVTIFYNSVEVISDDILATAISVTNTCNNIDIRNNIFSNTGGGYSYWIQAGSSVTTSDYNDYFATGNFLAYWGVNLEDISSLSALNGKDVNSVSVNPVFLSSNDLHTSTFRLEGLGDNSVNVTTDIDGDIRSGSPDIGADEFVGSGVPLSGTYTIGGGSPDFISFNAAVDSLNEVGVSGPVVFEIRNGNYNEQISILPVSGSSLTNTVTFTSENNDSNLVELYYGGGQYTNFVVQLNGADYVSFQQMSFSATNSSYGRVFSIFGNSHDNRISRNVINGIGSGNYHETIYCQDGLINTIEISQCLINAGKYGIRLDGENTSLAVGTLISDNIFSNQSYIAISLDDHNAPQVLGNVIDNTFGSNTWVGILLDGCDNSLKILKNTIHSTISAKGIQLSSCTGTTSNKGLIANNMIEIGGTSTSYGIYTNAVIYLNVYNNSIRISTTHLTAGIAFYNTGGSSIEVKNNILSNFGPAFAYYNNTASAVIVSNYNDLFTNGNYVGYWNGNRTDLASFQAANSMDVNSVSVNPAFVSATDLHATSSFLDGKGTPLALISDDFDGQIRDMEFPDIGADEFASSLLPMSGNYTIGGTTPAPDYATLTLAVADLNARGVSSLVTFNIRNGIYNEQIELFEIAGSSITDSIIFQSESGDSSTVSITYDAQNANEDYVIKLSNADNITFRNVSISASAYSYARAIMLIGNVMNVNIVHNIIGSTGTASSSAISSNGGTLNNIHINDNIISGGNNSVELVGIMTSPSTGIQVNGNLIFNSNTRGISLENQDSPIVTNNVVVGSTSNLRCINLENCDNALVLSGNKVENNSSVYGFYISNCNATVVAPGLITNNFIQIGGSSLSNGIRITNCDYQFLFHNSINCTSTSASSGNGIYTQGGSNLKLVNNIIANTGGGYAIYISSPSAILQSDNNDLYTSGVNLAYWTSAHTDLGSLQAVSGMDASSVSINPQFYTTTDLHILQSALNDAGTPLAQVVEDIDGNVRSASAPDIGAMEFTCDTPSFAVTVLPVCQGDSTTFVDNTSGVAPGSSYLWDFDNDWNYDYSSSVQNESFNYYFVSPGSHTVNLVIDQIAGCQDYISIPAIVNAVPVISITTQGEYCDSADGSASVSIISGSSPFSYSWSNGSTDSVLIGLVTGIYTIAVNDANNCVVTGAAEISSGMGITIDELSGATCGNEDGIATVVVSGGYSPFNYVWSNGVTDQTDSTLTPGIHYINVIDANGCISFSSFNISNIGTGPKVSFVTKVNNDCASDQNGSLNIVVTNGTSPYTFEWSNGATTEDISNLAHGVYTVIITDFDDCMSTYTDTIFAPNMISSSTVVTEASCAASNGSAVLLVSGGIPPYSYIWPSGGVFSVETDLSAGIYAVTITDDNGCTSVNPVIISNMGSPTVTLDYVNGVTCTNANAGSIGISVSGGTPLYNYYWTPGGQTTQDISGLSIGTYTVSVTDNVGCIGMASAQVLQTTPNIPEICMVTVDTTTGTNLVVWEKESTTDIQSYYIYKESTQTDIYYQIGQVDYSQEGLFTDPVSNPMQRSWRYKISAVDQCGNESDFSSMHKTMHLTSSVGLNSTVNLIWDHYQGFSFGMYYMYRYTGSSGWEVFDSISNNNFTYTDLAPPSDVQFYQVSAVKNGICAVNLAKTMSGPFSQSFSNLDDNGIILSVGKSATEMDFVIYPNPGTGIFFIRYTEKSSDIFINIFNLNGQLVYTDFLHHRNGALTDNLDLSNLPSGLYGIQVTSEKGSVGKKIIIE